MKTLDEIKRILEKHREELRKTYGVKEIGIFGSYISGKQRRRSDIDILVEFEKDIDFFVFLDLKDALESLLNHKIDLVMKSALKPGIGEQILKEVLYV